MDPSSPSTFLPRTVCSPLVVQVLQTKVSRLKELEMFLDELASEIVSEKESLLASTMLLVPGWVGSKALRPWKNNHKKSNWNPYAE